MLFTTPAGVARAAAGGGGAAATTVAAAAASAAPAVAAAAACTPTFFFPDGWTAVFILVWKVDGPGPYFAIAVSSDDGSYAAGCSGVFTMGDNAGRIQLRKNTGCFTEGNAGRNVASTSC